MKSSLDDVKVGPNFTDLDMSKPNPNFRVIFGGSDF